MTPAEQLAKKIGHRPCNLRDADRNIICHLRQLRTGLGLSQTAVADACQIHTSTYSGIECNQIPLVHIAMRLSRFFGTPIERIWVEIGGEA